MTLSRFLLQRDSCSTNTKLPLIFEIWFRINLSIWIWILICSHCWYMNINICISVGWLDNIDIWESPVFWISIQISTQVQVESLKYLMILIWISINKKERWVVLQYLMIFIWTSIIKKGRWVVLKYLRTPTTGSLPQCLVVASVRLNLNFNFFFIF